MRFRVLAALALALGVLTPLHGLGAGDPYLGIWHEVSEEPPGLRIEVVPGAPAELAGLRSGDVITEINGSSLATGDQPFAEQLRDALAGLAVGDTFTVKIARTTPRVVLTVNGAEVDTDFPLAELPEVIASAAPEEEIVLSAVRSAETLEIVVTLGARPGTTGPPFAPNDELRCDLPDLNPEVRELLRALSAEARVPAEQGDPLTWVSGGRTVAVDNADLRLRLDTRATPDDEYKLTRTVYLLRDGLKGEAVIRQVTDEVALAASERLGGLRRLQTHSAELLDLGGVYAEAPGLRTGMSAEEHLDVLELILNTAAVYVQQAFAGFSEEELEFIAEQRQQLTDVFSRHHYVDTEDDDPRRIRGNLELIALAKRIDYQQLILASLTLAQLADAQYLRGLKADLQAEFAGRLAEADLLVRETGFGRLVISGGGHSWRQGEAAALLVDLGGDDFYTTTAGSGASLARPVGVLLELGGDDAYESTTPYSQGSGSMGCGLLIDLDGDDQYVGLQWAQGSGYFGCGALVDAAGNDTYRGIEFCQAAAIFGTGLLLDLSGDDRVEGQMKCQAFGGAGGVGLLVDAAGNDERYCKGKYPTGYGDAGIFDAWGQGCAQGFRGIASGGIAGIVDLGGTDVNEAGNFSQGGGYYFGLGFFHDRGWEDDVYIGSRYNQGFCAHQAVGVFLEDGGDDYYTTRQAVAQGLAWDECCTMFIDYGGDDTYEGGTGFSQGASAHNAVCVMWDRGGRDTYLYGAGQGRAGGNDYHGGTSLSLFMDEGGAADFYTSERSGNDRITGWPEHGFFVDLPGTLEAALQADAWRALWTDSEG